MGVLFDGIDPKKEWGLIFLRDHYHPATPEMRNRTMTIPGMPGEWDFGSEWGPRPFSLPFGLIEYDRYELQRKLRALVAFLMDVYGKPREIKLSFDYEPDKYYSVKIVGKVDVERAIHTGQFDLPLIAHKPMAKSNQESDGVTMNSDISVLADITLDGEYVFNITQTKTINVINDGNTFVRPNIIINGTASNISLWNTENNDFFYINNVNGTYEVNGEKYTVKQGNVNKFDLMNGDFIRLIPGNNNIVVSGDNMNVSLTFRFNHQYI